MSIYTDSMLEGTAIPARYGDMRLSCDRSAPSRRYLNGTSFKYRKIENQRI